MAVKFRKFLDDVFPLGVGSVPSVIDEDGSDVDLDLKAMELAEFEKKLAIGDVDSDGSDFDEDLDNRKHGKLKRKSQDLTGKTKDKKQKLSKLHNERFMNETKEDFSQDNSQQEDDEDDEAVPTPPSSEGKIKKKKKKELNGTSEDKPRKIKIKKRKSISDIAQTTSEESTGATKSEKPKKAIKLNKESSPSSSGPFKVTDEEWSEPLQDGEVEFFMPSRKQKLKALKQVEEDEEAESTPKFVLNPFAKHTGTLKKQKESKTSPLTTPRIQLAQASGSTGKRVIIALNRNKAQTPHEYIKQVKESPNLPYDSSKKPTKSLLKPNVIPSPINPFYQKKIGLKLNFNETM